MVSLFIFKSVLYWLNALDKSTSSNCSLEYMNSVFVDTIILEHQIVSIFTLITLITC